MPPPRWQLPTGVNASLWEYAHSTRLAEEEDTYFAGHALFEADAQALQARFTAPGSLIDLGCGAGRHSIQFARRGFDVTAVDLSQPMVAKVAEKARTEGLKLQGLVANLCRLDCLPSDAFDYGLSMFSTLGMIRGHSARRKALREAARVLKPGGRLALHAHNLWLNLRDRHGRRWLLGQGARALLRDPELGDRTMTYRGIPGMQVHLFRWRELRGLFQEAGLEIEERLCIDEVHARPISAPWFFPGIRSGGWMVFARK